MCQQATYRHDDTGMERDGRDVGVFGRRIGREMQVGKFRDRIRRLSRKDGETGPRGQVNEGSGLVFADEFEEMLCDKKGAFHVDFLRKGETASAKIYAKETVSR